MELRRSKKPQAQSQGKEAVSFQQYSQTLKNSIEEISKVLAKHKKKKESIQTLSPTTPSTPQHMRKKSQKSLQQSSESSFIKSRNSNEGSVYSSSKQSQDDRKRKLIYGVEAYQEQQYQNFSTKNETEDIKFKSQEKLKLTETMSTQICNSFSSNVSISDFTLGKKLGSGKFGQVLLAMHNKTGFLCAIKRISKSIIDSKLQQQLSRQIKIQTFLNHPNIVKLFCFFADNKHIYLVQELCYSGQLFHFVKTKKKLSQELTRVIMQQVCKALDCMHEYQIIHRDIKPQNIIYQSGLVKICDFGWSISSKVMRDTFCGTPLYVSPELLKRKNYNNKIDVWSVGILTYQLLFGRVPFDIVAQKDFVKIVQDDIRFTGGTTVSEQAKDFIQACLKKDPRDRFTISELMQHPFISMLDNPQVSQLY